MPSDERLLPSLSPTKRTVGVDPRIPPLCDNQLLIDLIATVTGVDVRQVTRRFVAEHRDLGCNVAAALRAARIRPYEWSPQLEQFYATTDAFLYETVSWNRTTRKNDMRQWIGEHLATASDAPLRVLAYGDGLGIDSYYLAQLGHEVTYFDVSQPCMHFAKTIFSSGNLPIKIVTDPSALPANHFEAIVCLDTLEHVPDPRKLVGWLVNLLQPAGRFIVHSPFYFIHPCVATHLHSNCRYSGDLRRLFTPLGLFPIDGRMFWDPLVLEKSNGGGTAKRSPAFWQVLLGGALLHLGRWPVNPITLFARRLSGRGGLPALVAGLEEC